MQQRETNKYSCSWYPITLAQSTRGLGIFGVCMRKWLNDVQSPLVNFFSKRARSEGDFVDIIDTKVF